MKNRVVWPLVLVLLMILFYLPGGLTFGTLLTLYVVPVAYILITRRPVTNAGTRARANLSLP